MKKLIYVHFDSQTTVLADSPFCSIVNNYQFRAFHAHNCIEMTYVMSGTADQIMIYHDGSTGTQKLSKGNYVIMDARTKHAYRNGSDDFIVLNLLFKSPFLFDSHGSRRSMSSPNALSVTRRKWHDEKEANGIELNFELNHPQALGAKKYIRVWMDLGGESEKIDFAQARFGLIVNDDKSNPYLTQGSPQSLFYFMSEDSDKDKWITMTCGRDGCFGADGGSSVKGLKGWFAFPIDNMCQEKKSRALSRKDVITGIYFYYSMSEKQMAGKPLYIDDLVLVEDFRSATKDVLGGDKALGFGEGGEIIVTGKHGKDMSDVYLEEIEVGDCEKEDFYELVKKGYPEFDYEKLSASPINQIYFDRDGSILPLFKMCHTCSKEHWYEWEKMVKNGISLILLLSLQSMFYQESREKESIIDIVKNYVEAHCSENVTLAKICEIYFYNASYVSRRFKEVANCSFEQYLRQVRIKKAGELLLTTNLPVHIIGEKCGYSSVGAFRKAFSAVTGKNPLAFRKKFNNQ